MESTTVKQKYHIWQVIKLVEVEKRAEYNDFGYKIKGIKYCLKREYINKYLDIDIYKFSEV